MIRSCSFQNLISLKADLKTIFLRLYGRVLEMVVFIGMMLVGGGHTRYMPVSSSNIETVYFLMIDDRRR